MGPQHIIDVCENKWDANKSDFSGFVKAVSSALGVTLSQMLAMPTPL